jgi:hypothetical protein
MRILSVVIVMLLTVVMFFTPGNLSTVITPLSSANNGHLASEAPWTTVYVNPQNNTYNLDEIFTIEVIVDNVSDLYGFDIAFAWNPAILEYVNHTATVPVEDFPGGILHEPVLPILDSVNATAGTYEVAKASMDPALSFTGTGTAFNMTFRVKSTNGACLLDIVRVDLSDHEGEIIPKTIIDGLFSPVSAPEAAFTWWPYTGVVNEPVIFNASESRDLDGVVSEYYWDFGDGNMTSITDPVINHTFSHLLDTKSYTVSLIVEDGTGINSSEVQHQITVVKSRNIKIETISLSTPSILVNGTVHVIITAANEGYVSENTTVKAYYNTSSSDWSLLASFDLSIPGLDSKFPRFDWNTTGVVPNEYYVVKANATAVPYENETDNTGISQAIFITSVEMHDMMVTKLTVSAYDPVAHLEWGPLIILGEDAAFEVVVANNGTVPEDIFSVILYSNGTVINQWNVNETFEPGFTRKFTYTWSEIDQIGDYNITVQATVGNDANLANNYRHQDLKVVDVPLLNITCTPEPAIVNETVTLDASGSVHRDPEGQIVSFVWTIYEPGVTPPITPISVPNATLNGAVVTFNFPTEGNWTIVLTVTDNYGLTYNFIRTLTSSYRSETELPIIPELSPLSMLLLLMTATLLAIITYKRKSEPK